mgnify:CR=1 FL=1
MKCLGIDFGLKRVGLAISDAVGVMALPLATLERTDNQTLFAELLAVLDRERVQTVVVGIPYGLNGEETLSTRQALNFVDRLKRRSDLPVITVDETLSSAIAEQRLADAGIPGKKRKPVLDQVAAQVILETYLNQNP